MGGIKAIETSYNGYRFRSRLEARWAVFFDTAKIKYAYEPEGYDLGEFGWYLPDFYLPYIKYRVEGGHIPTATGVFIEIKPTFNKEDRKKYHAFYKMTSHPLVLLVGAPTVTEGCDGVEGEFGCYEHGIMDDDMLLQGQPDDYSFEFDHWKYFHGFGDELQKAVVAARSARFEHGETPRIR